jgi:hypothetical protein
MSKIREIGKEIIKVPAVLGWVLATIIDGTRFMVRTEDVMKELGQELTEEKHDELLETYVKIQRYAFNSKPINKFFGIRLED